MTVVTKQLPEEAAAIKFVRQKLREIEQDEDHLAQAAEAVDVLPDGIKALARRDMSLEKAYRIAVALGLTNEFVSHLRTPTPGIAFPSVEPSARVIFSRLLGQKFNTWRDFGKQLQRIAADVGPDLPPYYDEREVLTFAEDRNWFSVSNDNGSVVVVASLD
jgi:hypothetical protein